MTTGTSPRLFTGSSFYGFDKSCKCRYLLYRITDKIAILFPGFQRKQFLNKIGIIRSQKPLCTEWKMPELPEVETLCRQLVKTITGQTLLDILVLDSKMPEITELTGRRVSRVERRGKKILLSFDDGQILAVHLRMTGRLLWQEEVKEIPQYTRLILTFTAGRVFFIDPRRFLTIQKERDSSSYHGGVDPLQNLTPEYLAARGRPRKGSVKSFLLDQSVIAGIGNIYACEILHHAGIDPARPACRITDAQWHRIALSTKEVLGRAVACRGTTVSDWRDFHGRKGSFQHELRVYRRAGLPCPRCGKIVARCLIAGRGTYFCPGCQV